MLKNSFHDAQYTKIINYDCDDTFAGIYKVLDSTYFGNLPLDLPLYPLNVLIRCSEPLRTDGINASSPAS